jgi:hypothetical protein
MPDDVSPGISRAAAVEQLGGWLTGTLGAKPVGANKLQRPFTEGWELAVDLEGAP